MTSSVTSPQPASASSGQPSKLTLLTRIFAFTPLWVLIAASLFAPTFVPAMLAVPPTIIGIPLGLVVEALAFVWMLIGVVVIWNARSRYVELLALTVFTIPATVVVVYSPGVILIIENLG